MGRRVLGVFLVSLLSLQGVLSAREVDDATLAHRRATIEEKLLPGWKPGASPRHGNRVARELREEIGRAHV